MSKKSNTPTEYKLNKEISNRYNLAKNAYTLFNELVEQAIHNTFADRPDQEFRFSVNPPSMPDPWGDTEKRVAVKAIQYVCGIVMVAFHSDRLDSAPIYRFSTYDQYRLLDIIVDNIRCKNPFSQGSWEKAETLDKVVKERKTN